MDALTLTSEDSGVTEYARKLLADDARLGTRRDFRLIGDNEERLFTGEFLGVWTEYETTDAMRAMYVVLDGIDHLVHRKHDPRVGFTPFAKERLLHPTGHARDTKARTYVMGGKDADGKRLRREMKATILVVWLDYAAIKDYTHLWVKWKDGTRKLVHRKGL